MSVPTGIDNDAPIRTRHEIGINAPLGLVWRLHTNVNNWPAGQTDITAARLDGPFEPGNSFTWTSNGFTVTSTIYAVAEGARTLWGGTAEGITGTHEWVYSQTPAGVYDPAVHELVMALLNDQTITNAWTGTSQLEFPEVPARNCMTWRHCGPGRASASSSPTRSPTCGP